MMLNLQGAIMELIAILVFAAVLGCIPGAIAQSKGRDFLPWWFYGWMLFIVALIHSLVLTPYAKPAIASASTQVSSADELVKFAELRDKGVITEAEFNAQKARILTAFSPSIVTGR